MLKIKENKGGIPVPLILVVDDEDAIVDVIKSYLQRDGFQVATAGTGAEALSKARSLLPDLVVLDLMLPDIHGEEVARLLREENDPGIIMLTAKSGQDDRIAGLSLGVDDYVIKPFSPRELVLRVKNVLRRVKRTEPAVTLSFQAGQLVIDKTKQTVAYVGQVLDLTPSEYKLLLTLAENPGRPFTRSELISRIQGYDFPGYDRVIDAHVKNLRRKLQEDGKESLFVQTVYGTGYKFGGQRDA